MNKPFAANRRQFEAARAQAIANKQSFGRDYGVFFSTSGRLMVEPLNPGRQYPYHFTTENIAIRSHSQAPFARPRSNPKPYLNPLYEVIVGNIGKVHQSSSKAQALKHYREYVDQSKREYGRAAGEDVSLWKDGEPIQEFMGRLSREQAGDDLETNPRAQQRGGFVLKGRLRPNPAKPYYRFGARSAAEEKALASTCMNMPGTREIIRPISESYFRPALEALKRKLPRPSTPYARPVRVNVFKTAPGVFDLFLQHGGGWDKWNWRAGQAHFVEAAPVIPKSAGLKVNAVPEPMFDFIQSLYA